MEIVYALSNSKELDGWGWALVGGIFDLLFGIVLTSSPILSMGILAFYAGFGLLMRSVMAMGAAFELKSNGSRNWGLLLAVGIGGLQFSFILIFNPAFAGMTIVIWTALAFITIGIFRITMAFKLKNLHDLSKQVQ